MEKLHKLRKEMQAANIDAFLITNGQNRRYMTGFIGTAGVVLVTLTESFFITDFRYTVQAKEQVKNYEIIEHKGPIHEEVASLVKKTGVDRLGFEKQAMTYAIYEIYKKELSSEWIPVNGLVEKLRIIKTESELEIMKEAGKIADAAYEHIQGFIK